jgi:hypothetical protein
MDGRKDGRDAGRKGGISENAALQEEQGSSSMTNSQSLFLKHEL